MQKLETIKLSERFSHLLTSRCDAGADADEGTFEMYNGRTIHTVDIYKNTRYNITKVAAVIWNISPNVRRDAVLAGQVKTS